VMNINTSANLFPTYTKIQHFGHKIYFLI